MIVGSFEILYNKECILFPGPSLAFTRDQQRRHNAFLMGVTPLEKNHWSVKFNFEHDRNNPGKISSRNLLQNKPIREGRVIFVGYVTAGCGVFKSRDTKFESLKINCSQMKLLNFENWCNGEVSKIGHRFRKWSDLKIDIIKKRQ